MGSCTCESGLVPTFIEYRQQGSSNATGIHDSDETMHNPIHTLKSIILTDYKHNVNTRALLKGLDNDQ